jgi:hypothetical protein
MELPKRSQTSHTSIRNLGRYLEEKVVIHVALLRHYARAKLLRNYVVAESGERQISGEKQGEKGHSKREAWAATRPEPLSRARIGRDQTA